MSQNQSKIDQLSRITNPTKELNFHFIAYRNLTKDLGFADALIAYNELALREFLEAAEASDDKSLFIKDLAIKHKISVYGDQLSNLQNRISQLYILSVYQYFEKFLIDFKSEHCMSNDWRKKRDDECWIDYVLDNIGGLSNNKKRIGAHRYAVCDYYRLVRNRFVHLYKSEKKIEAAYEDVTEHINDIHTDFNLSAPNMFEGINMDDFLLFTRAVKYVAVDICRIATPNEEQILDMLDKLNKSDSEKFRYSRILHFVSSRRRVHQKLSGTLFSLYMYKTPPSEEMLDNFIGRALNSKKCF